MAALEIVQSVLTVALEIYKIVEEVRSNKTRCKRLKRRIESLVKPVEHVRDLNANDQEVYRKALADLLKCLKSSKTFIAEFKSIHFVRKIWKREEIKSRFDDINVRLDQLVPALTLGLNATMKSTIDQMFDKTTKIQQDIEDEKNDWKSFQEMVEDIRRGQTILREEVDSGFQELHIENERMAESISNLTGIYGEIAAALAQRREAEKRGSIIVQPRNDLKYINSSELSIKEVIGEGDSSTTYKAVYKTTSDVVAVKMFDIPKIGSNEKLKLSLRKEAENLKKLEAMNVIRLFGICTEPDKFLHIMEYMPWTLREVLDHKKHNLNVRLQIRMALEGASGLFRIHNGEPPMLHRCVSSVTFLVNEDLHVKISDVRFCLTKSSAARHSSSSKKTNLTYIAPEHLQPSGIHLKYNERSEVYSYGIVMWEIATFKTPYEGMTDKQIDDYVVNKKKMEPIPSDCTCPPDLCNLIDRCRSHNELLRPPNFGEIVDTLGLIYTTLPSM
ncbi:mixed lineage kinase domain-like protein [Glandiceps talaboti]